MKPFFKYLSYRIRVTLPRLVIIGVMTVLLTEVFSGASTETTTYASSYSVYYSFQIFPWVLFALTFLLPILELSGLHNRRNLDALLSLPVSHAKMALAHGINGILQLTLLSAAAFVPIFLKGLTVADYIIFPMMIPYYLLSLLSAIALYFFFSFFFIQANNTADGVIFQCLAICACAMPLLLLSKFDIYMIDADYLIASEPIFLLYDHYRHLVLPGAPSIMDMKDTITCMAWGLIGIVAAIGYVVTFTRRKAEKVGGISNSPFGYASMIPLYAITFSYSTGLDTLAVLTLIATVVSYTIYRRGFRFKTLDVAVMITTLIVGFI